MSSIQCNEQQVMVMQSGLRWIWIAVIVIALDHWTKGLASEHLTLYQPEALMPMLNLTLSHNTGAAFSFLHDAGGWQRWFFTGLALTVSVVLFVWLSRIAKDKAWEPIALTLVMGGALGNVWDRIALGYVVDFIDVYYQTWHWPAFNVADSAISIGAVMLLIDALRTKKHSNTLN